MTIEAGMKLRVEGRIGTVIGIELPEDSSRRFRIDQPTAVLVMADNGRTKRFPIWKLTVIAEEIK